MDFIFQFTILFKKFRVILYFVNRPLKNMHSNHTGNYKYLQLAKKKPYTDFKHIKGMFMY